jgi:hypothetical protein
MYIEEFAGMSEDMSLPERMSKNASRCVRKYVPKHFRHLQKDMPEDMSE